MPSTGAGHSSHGLQCLEVWGGNERVETRVSVPGIEAWVYSEPFEGHSQGGDICYLSTCGGGKVSRFVVADVSGHGSSAGGLAERLRRLMRKHILALNPTRFARALNREFSKLESSGRFATALLLTYFAPTDHLILCNAGHPMPLWYHAESGSWEALRHDMPGRAERVKNVPLGVIEPGDYVQFAVELAPGDLVLLYTDWLVDCRNRDGEPLGTEGLLAFVRQLEAVHPSRLRSQLLGLVAGHRGHDVAEDDQTLVVLHHNASNPPRQSLSTKMRALSKMLGLGR